MGLVTTVGNYCYVQCDRRNCNKKLEHVDLKLLKELARVCGWERSGTQWTCPTCSERAEAGKASKTKRKRNRKVSGRTRDLAG
jgi:hypothetical protein